MDELEFLTTEPVKTVVLSEKNEIGTKKTEILN
jgi:hypothetical protein